MPHKCSTVTEIVDIPVPLIVVEQTAEMIQVIPQERVTGPAY